MISRLCNGKLSVSDFCAYLKLWTDVKVWTFEELAYTQWILRLLLKSVLCSMLHFDNEPGEEKHIAAVNIEGQGSSAMKDMFCRTCTWSLCIIRCL